jgi:hypothetical protein
VTILFSLSTGWISHVVRIDRKVVDDIVIEVNCRMITIQSGANVDIGANPSTEEQEEALEDGATQVNDVIHSFRLQPTSFDKKSYLAYLKVALSMSSDPLGH